jgi:pyruvate kinase
VLERRRARTKILATLGPASASRARIEELVRAGADAFRLNMSHGDEATLRSWAALVRSVRRDLQRPVSLVVDLRGPRIRLGELPQERVLRRGELVRLTAGRRAVGDALPVDYRRLGEDLQPGQRVLIRDGRVELKVLRRARGGFECVGRRGDLIRSNQGVNLPDSRVSAPALSPKDRADVRFAVENGADWIALSFVRSADDVRALRREIARHGSDIPVIAKIEHPQALERLSEILDATDAVMIARGDLAVEVGHALVPTVQKRIVRACILKSVPVIVATQMLESMLETAQPTRAEVSDVANAVVDGVDAVMLSGETAVGAHAIAACRTMHEIVAETEKGLFHDTWRLRPSLRPEGKPGQELETATVDAALALAERAGARLLLAFTESGRSVRLSASFRARIPLVALTSREATLHRLALIWGVMPGRLPRVKRIREMNREALALLRRHRLLTGRDLLVVLTGTFAVSGATNTVRLIRRDQLA